MLKRKINSSSPEWDNVEEARKLQQTCPFRVALEWEDALVKISHNNRLDGNGMGTHWKED